MGQAISTIIGWIFSWDDESSDHHQQQQNNPNETLTPPLLTINSSSSPSFESTINIRSDNNSNNNKAAPLRTPLCSSTINIRSSSPEYPDSLRRTSSSQCDSKEEEFVYSQSINGLVGYYWIDVTEALNRVIEELAAVIKKTKWINHYCSLQRILLVGEGDFSFSASLGKAFGSAANIIATSLDSQEFLRSNYTKAMSNIQSLRARGGMVLHGVDATKMENHLLLKGIKFDRIIFNFPLAGFFPRKSRHSDIRRHRALVSGFLENAKKMISENGEIHITHKSNGFFRDWKLEVIAFAHGLRLVEELCFNFTDYPGYNTKYGFGGDNNFNCNPSKTYKFGLASSISH